MIDERHIFAARFRELAERFVNKEYAEIGVVDENGRPVATELSKQAVLDEAGELTTAAYRLGFLALPGLAKLVDWVDNSPPRPEEAQATLYPCPSNVFMELCGFHQVPVVVRGGQLEIVGDNEGGILPTMLENSPALPRPRQSQTRYGQDATLRRQYGLVCKLLADEIERTSGEDARDCWIYEQATISRTWQWIAENIPDWCRDREQVTTPNGVKKAATRYAEKHGLPPIQKRKTGRPRNTN
ncbi:MAG: hypothetical protein GXX96_09980 [Planctomycetaceae bacterium]|nr:hypothetical protein [Planctomycetaceae bacterium]